MIKKIFLIVLTSITFLNLSSQIEVDKPLIFNSVYDSLRNVYNVAKTADATNGISIKTSFEDNILFSESTETSPNNFNLTTKALPIAVAEGLQIQFKVPENTTGALFITINGVGSYEVVKYSNQSLEDGDLKKDQMIDIIFDGVNFQILNFKRQGLCPNGFVSVNNDYCIQIAANPAMTWYEAAKFCMDTGAKLCNWSEFNLACELLVDASNDFTTQWEWTSSTGDHHTSAHIAGLNGCQEGDTKVAWFDNVAFRCCYEK